MIASTLYIDQNEIKFSLGIKVNTEPGGTYYLSVGGARRIPLNASVLVIKNKIYHCYIRKDDSSGYRIAKSDISKSEGVLILARGIKSVSHTLHFTVYLKSGNDYILLVHEVEKFGQVEVIFQDDRSTILNKKVLMELLR